jgi:cytoskeletal protein CcmA (bactofilin family)
MHYHTRFSDTMHSPNHLSNDVEINGMLHTKADCYFDGKIDGEIHTTGILTVGPNATVKGNVHATAASIEGNMTGNVHLLASGRLQAGSKLKGDIFAATFQIEEGAIFSGRAAIGKL